MAGSISFHTEKSEKMSKANERLREANRLELAEQATKSAVDLARVEIALVLMSIVSAKVAIGKPTTEEREIDMIAKLISERSGGVTKEELLKALGSFKDTSDPQE